jgi:hypothetical protein
VERVELLADNQQHQHQVLDLLLMVEYPKVRLHPVVVVVVVCWEVFLVMVAKAQPTTMQIPGP